MLDRLLPWLFATLAGPACLFLALAVPPGEVPDEAAHAVRADSLWQGELLGHRVGGLDAPPAAGVDADLGLRAVASTFAEIALAQKRVTAERQAALDQVPWAAAPSFVPAPNVAVYLPVLYVPAAIGLGVARAAGLRPLRALLVARMLNAMAFVALGGMALAIARSGQVVMFVTLMLPTSLWLAGSVNPDGLLIATAVLAAAALTRPSAGYRWVAGIGIALLGAVKPCYLPLALAMFARCRREDLTLRSLRREALVAGAVAAPGVAWAVAALVVVSVPFARPPYPPGPLWPGDPGRVFHATDVGAQLRVLAARPWRLLSLPFGSLRAQLRNLAISAIGVLGRLDLALPARLYAAWTLAGLAAGGADLLAVRREGGVGPFGAAAIVAGMAASVLAIFLLQYLSWTAVGSAVIEGVQGRYFVPLLPFAGIALSAAPIADRPRLRLAAATAPVLLAAGSAAVVARLVVTTYYLR